MPSQRNPLFTRLRKHADYERVYVSSRKQFSKQMSYFFSVRLGAGRDGLPLQEIGRETPRIGMTVGKVMGKAVDRNRIKRRLRELIRSNVSLLHGPIDVVLHPRRSVIDLDFAILAREVRTVFQTIQRLVERGARSAPQQSPALVDRSRPPVSPSLPHGPKP